MDMSTDGEKESTLTGLVKSFAFHVSRPRDT